MSDLTKSFDAIPARLRHLLDGALGGAAPDRAACVDLLAFPETSLEAGVIRAVADAVSRRRFRGEAVMLGQIGVDMAPCDAGCAFCAFARPHTTIQASTLTPEETIARAQAFARGGAAGIFIMTMHRFGFDWFVDLIARVGRTLPPQTPLLANVGDLSLEQLEALRGAGMTGAYHVVRLGEGRDTHLAPADRRRTIERIRRAGLDWYNSCEPIGPEHTPAELVDQIFIGLELGCHQHAAMRRFPVPGSPLQKHGQLPLARLAQIVAVIALASLETATVRSVAVHESNHLGLMSGANALYPEAGEPAETPREGDESREGFSSALWRQSTEISTADCRRMLRETGFTALRGGDGTVRPLARCEAAA